MDKKANDLREEALIQDRKLADMRKAQVERERENLDALREAYRNKGPNLPSLERGGYTPFYQSRSRDRSLSRLPADLPDEDEKRPEVTSQITPIGGTEIINLTSDVKEQSKVKRAKAAEGGGPTTLIVLGIGLLVLAYLAGEA